MSSALTLKRSGDPARFLATPALLLPLFRARARRWLGTPVTSAEQASIVGNIYSGTSGLTKGNVPLHAPNATSHSLAGRHISGAPAEPVTDRRNQYQRYVAKASRRARKECKPWWAISDCHSLQGKSRVPDVLAVQVTL